MAAALLREPKVREISQDEHERARLRSRKMYEMDRVSDLLTAEERGEIRGRAEGKAEGKAEIIALLEKGLTLEEIKKI